MFRCTTWVGTRRRLTSIDRDFPIPSFLIAKLCIGSEIAMTQLHRWHDVMPDLQLES